MSMISLRAYWTMVGPRRDALVEALRRNVEARARLEAEAHELTQEILKFETGAVRWVEETERYLRTSQPQPQLPHPRETPQKAQVA